VAHDLRAPLRSIDGFSLALLEDCGDRLDDDSRRYLHYVRESAQHMARLIDDLLALSRVTRGELNRGETHLRVRWPGASSLAFNGQLLIAGSMLLWRMELSPTATIDY
jgi:signal transduction histidine kinase